MKKENIFWGLFLILSALLILATKLGVFPNTDIGIVTLLFTVFFVAGLIKSIVSLEFPGIFFCLAFLGILYDDQLGITAITPWTILGVALLLSIGVSMIYHPKRKYIHNHSQEHFSKSHGKFGPNNDCEVVNEADGSQFHYTSTFTGSIKYVNSDNFESGDVEARFASVTVYFDNAIIQKGEAVLNLDVSFAGVELYFPRNWNVVNQVNASFGGVEEKNQRSNSADGPTLYLRGNVSLGGVTIMYC